MEPKDQATYPALDVIGCGSLNLDYVYYVDRLVGEGVGALERSRISPGGSASNTIFGLARLGLRTGFIGAVGDDERGKAILANMTNAGVDTGRIRVKTMAQSGSVVTLVDALRKRALYMSPGANDLLSRNDVELGYACNAAFLHLSGFSGRKQFSLQVDLASCQGASTQVSIGATAIFARAGMGTLAPLLKNTSIMFINREQLGALTGEDVEAGARMCRARGVRTVVVLLGKGIRKRAGTAVAYVLGEGKGSYVVPPGIDLPVAAGNGLVDSFAAGFLYGRVKGKEAEECIALGDAVARIALSGNAGARAGMPSLAELGRHLKVKP